MIPYPGTEIGRMAVAGEGGYLLKSTDWDDYKHALSGNVLEFSGITRPQLEWLQMGAYLKLFLRNGRLWGLAKFIWHYRTGALTWFNKLVLGRRSQETVLERPQDYDAVIDRQSEVSLAQVTAARDQWKAIQIRELGRARAKQPGLLPVIHADNVGQAAARQPTRRD
jgi:hypothetical protein